MKKLLFAMIALSSLCCKKAKDPIPLSSPTAEDRAGYQAAVNHVISRHVFGNFGVVSLKTDGSPEHAGEALIWGGTALWALPCAAGQGISDGLRAMILDQGGAMIRVDPLGEYDDGRQITLDGALGAFLGIARRVADCGEMVDWREPLRAILAFQEANGDRMHPGSENRLIGEFTAVRDMIAYNVGLADRPTDQRFRELEQTVGGWATAVEIAHETKIGSDACYRVNLGLTAYLSDEAGGQPVSQLGRDQFCAATRSMDIPTIDNFCGRKPIVEYLASYEPNAWEFRHQRCGKWEQPDGDGNESPGVDKLVAYILAYGWHSLQ